MTIAYIEAVGSRNIAPFTIPFVILVLIVAIVVMWKQSRNGK